MSDAGTNAHLSEGRDDLWCSFLKREGSCPFDYGNYSVNDVWKETSPMV